jgi:hypothetical protein
MDVEQMKEKCLLYFREFGRGIPPIYTTAEFSDPNEQLSYQDSIMIKASVSKGVVLCFICGVWLAFFASLPLHVAHYKFPFLLLWAGGSLVAAFILLVASKKNLRPLVLDKKGIAFRGEALAWSDIMETFIVDLNPARHYTSKSLVIMDKFENVYKFRFDYLAVDAKKLSALIEYYKTNRD